MPYIRLPDDSYFKFPDDEAPEAAYARAQAKYPEAFKAPTPPDTGFTGAFKAGVESLKGDVAAIGAGLHLPGAQEAALQHQEEAKRMFKPTQEGWTEAPWEKFKELAGGSLPYVAAPIVAGLGGRALGATEAAATGLAGLASAAQFTGSNLSRQLEEGRRGDELELSSAAAASIPQAAFDMLSFKMTPAIRRIFGAAGKEIPESVAARIAKQGTTQVIADYAKQGIKTAGVEGLTEAGQQFFERLQAGLDLTDEQARNEYFDNFIGGAVLGGALSVPGRFVERGSIKSEERAREAKAEQDRLLQEQEAADAERRSPENINKLRTRQAELNGLSFELNAILKDPNVSEEAKAEAKDRLTTVSDEISSIKDELGELAPTKSTVEGLDQVLRARAEQRRSLATQAGVARVNPQEMIQRFTGLDTEVETLKTDLQTAMKEGNVAKIEQLGDLLDKKTGELDKLFNVSKAAGIDIRTPTAQLKTAQLNLAKAKKALAEASENEAVALDPSKRNKLVQDVVQKQKTVDELMANKEALLAKSASSEELAEKQRTRTELLNQEELEGYQPFDPDFYNIKSREDLNNKLAGLVAQSREHQSNFNTIGDEGVTRENFEQSNGYKLSTQVEDNKLSPMYANMLGLPNPRNNANFWYFDKPNKNTAALQEAVINEVEKIRANADLAAQYGLDLPQDPRLPYLEDLFAKLNALHKEPEKQARFAPGELKAEPATYQVTPKQTKMLNLRRRTRGEGNTFIETYGKRNIADYTPKHIASLRANIAELDGILKANESFEKRKEAALSNVKKKLKKANKSLENIDKAKKFVDKPEAKASAKKGLKAAIANYNKSIDEIESREAMDPATVARLQRRKNRLEQELQDATLPVRTTGKATKGLRLESRFETYQNKLSSAKTPKQEQGINKKLADIESKLNALGYKYDKDTGRFIPAVIQSTLPKGGVSGTPVVPSKRGEGLLVDIMDTIDSLRKGEFFGGAAGEEGKSGKMLESQSRPVILKGLKQDVDKFAESMISTINVERQAAKAKPLTKQQEQEIRSVVYEALAGKALRATGWRAEKQRSVKGRLSADTAIVQAFKAAGFDVSKISDDVKYADAVKKLGQTELKYSAEDQQRINELETKIDNYELALAEAKKRKDVVQTFAYTERLKNIKAAYEVVRNQPKFYSGEANDYMRKLADSIVSLEESASRLGDHMLETMVSEGNVPARDANGNLQYSDAVSSWKIKFTRASKALQDARNEYNRAMRAFLEGEAEGKGEIRTGMRESERSDIRDFMDGIRRSFGVAKPAEVVEEDTTTLPKLKPIPESILAIDKEAKAILAENASLAKGLAELVEMLIPTEARQAKAAAETLARDKRQRVPQSDEKGLKHAKRTQEIYPNAMAIADMYGRGDVRALLDEANRLDQEASRLGFWTPATESISDDLYDQANMMRLEAADLTKQLLKDLQGIYAEGKAEADQRVKKDFEDLFKKLREGNDAYQAKAKEFKEKLTEHIQAERSAEGVQRAKERLEEDQKIGAAIKAGEARTRQQTGLGLPGTAQKVEITQAAIDNVTFEAISNMLKKLTRLYEATKQEPKGAALMSANERAESMAPAKKEYEEYLDRFKQKLADNNLTDTKLGNAYLELYKVAKESPQGKALRKTIASEIELLNENAAQITSKEKVRSDIVTEPTKRAEEKEALKSLQSEQTEETGRKLARQKERMSEKKRASELAKARKALDKHLATPMPEDAKAARSYRDKTIGLKAEIDVLTNADLPILLARGLSKREKSELRHKPTAMERLYALDPVAKAKKLDSLRKQLAALISKGVPTSKSETVVANYKRKIKDLTKQVGVLSRQETGGITSDQHTVLTKQAAQDIDTVEARQKELERVARETAEAEDTLEHDKKISDKQRKELEETVAFNRKWMSAVATTEERQSTLFQQALNRVNYEEQGAAAAGMSLREVNQLIDKAELQKVNAWAEEAKDAEINLDDFSGLYENLRGEWDARLGDAGYLGNVTADDVRNRLAKLNMPKGMKVLVIEKMTPTLRGAALQSGYTQAQIDTLRGGVLPDGTVFIVANTHSNMKDVEKTIAHEMIGHIGAETLIGDKGMRDLANRLAKQKDGVMGLAKALGIEDKVSAAYLAALQSGKSAEEAGANAVREIIAYTTEGRVDKGMLGKIGEFLKAMVGYIRAGLRKLGLDLDISTSDIYKITLQATKNFSKVVPGVYTMPNGQTLYRAGDVEFGPSSEEFRALAGKVLNKQKTLRERFWPSNLGLILETKYVAGQAPLQQVFANKGMKDSYLASQTEYYINMRQQFMTWTMQAMSTGVPVLKSTKRADGNTEHILKSDRGANLADLAKVLGEAKWGNAEGVRNAYSLYRIAKRAKRVGLEVLNFRGDVTEKDLKAVEDLVRNNPALRAAFEKADKIYNQYNRDLMALMVKTGALSKAVADDMVKYDDYVPYYRIDRNDNVVLNVGGAQNIRVGNLKDQPYLQDLVGGDERIVDIFTGSVQNTNLLMNMALTNLATRNVAFALSQLGLLKRRTDKTGKAIGTGIHLGDGPADGKTLRFSVEPDPNIQGDDGSRYVTVDTDLAGVDSRLLVHGLSGINVALPTMVKAMNVPARWLRSWVTRNPVYAARQMLRDPLVAGLASGVDELPIVASLRTAWNAMQGRDKSEEMLQGLGLVGGQVMSGLPEDQQKILLHITAGTTGWEGFKAKMDRLSMQGDAATRAVAFNNFRKQGLSEMEAVVATYKMMPFTQRGTSASLYMLSTMVPFLNAQIQGLNVLWKSFTGNMPFNEKLRIRQKLLQRGAALFAMSMIYAIMMQDDEAYKNANDDERLNNWFIKIPGFKEAFKFPVPFELGIIFKAIPESLVNVMMGDKKAVDALDGLRKMIITSTPLGLSSIPTAVKAPLEVMMDYSTFTGRSIIGERLKDVKPEEQFNENTSELAKLVGGATGQIPVLGKYLSPIQLEYLARSYTGSIPLVLSSMANPLLARGGQGPKPETRLNEVPVFGSLFQPADAGGAINQVYKDLGEATKADRTYKKLIEEGRDIDAEAFANKYADQMSMSKMAVQFRKTMAELSKAERAARMDPDMSPQEKRKMLDDIKQMKIETAKNFSGRG